MRVAVLAAGSRGDAEIFFALAAELRSRGYDVSVFGPGFLRESAARRRLGFHDVPGLEQARLQSALRAAGREPDLVPRAGVVGRLWAAGPLQRFLARPPQVLLAADYFVSNLKVLLKVGDRRLPGALVTYDLPNGLDDLERFSGAGGAGQSAGPGAAHIVANESTGGSEIPALHQPLELVAFPRELVDPDGRWGRRLFTGFWSDAVCTAQSGSDGDLLRFLEAGQPPVVLSLGSMPLPRDGVLPELCAVLRRMGHRLVLVGGESDLGLVGKDIQSSDEVFFTAEANYRELFARACSVLHRGGSGTVSEVLKAGIPNVVLPFLECQRQLGECLFHANLTTAVLTESRTPEFVARKLDEASRDTQSRAALAAWRERHPATDGVLRAVDAIEAHAEGRPNDS